jgi:hypothetical protein
MELKNLRNFIQNPLDNRTNIEYTSKEAEDMASLIYAQAVQLLRGKTTDIDDPVLVDCAVLFLALVRLYIPHFRRDYE